MCLCDLPIKLFTPNGCEVRSLDSLYFKDLEIGYRRVTLTAQILAAIGAVALLAGGVLGGLVVAGLALPTLVAMSFPLIVGALAVAAVAFSLAYVANASANAAVARKIFNSPLD